MYRYDSPRAEMFPYLTRAHAVWRPAPITDQSIKDGLAVVLVTRVPGDLKLRGAFLAVPSVSSELLVRGQIYHCVSRYRDVVLYDGISVLWQDQLLLNCLPVGILPA